MPGDTCLYGTTFAKDIEAKILQIDALLMVNVILVALMVGIGAYGHRYRHRPVTRFLYDGATSLFLPIMSYIISAFDYHFFTGFLVGEKIIGVECRARNQGIIFIHLAGQIHIVAINTSTMVAGDDREGRNIGLPVILLVQVAWTSYLAVYTSGRGLSGTDEFKLKVLWYTIRNGFGYLVISTFAIIFAKTIFKVYAFYKVRRSYAFARNPRLVVGYMLQPLQDGNHYSEHAPPPLLVMGEDTVQVEKQPHGHNFIRMSEEGGATDMGMKRLVTMDKVWQLDDMLLGSTATRLKDVCLSFSLFKLLRCRFARYTIAEAGFHKVYSFFWHVLKDGNDERVLGIITDELSFLYDYYYTSLPISYPNHWLPILSILISLLSIIYCLLIEIIFVALLSNGVKYTSNGVKYPVEQVSCQTSWERCETGGYHFGKLFFVVLPPALLGILVVLTETREIASYICSNWTKVALICCYTNHVSWQKFRAMQKCIRCVLRCRCKLLRHWDDKMSQCSILVLHPRKTSLALLRRLIGLPDQTKKVEVPRAVKVAVLDTLRNYEGSTSSCVASYRRSLHVGENLHWTFNGKGTADTMLVCHIATSILDVRSEQNNQPLSDHKIVATHLSRYCAYLVAYSPELLPDDDAWCKSLYKVVKKDADRILIGGTGIGVGVSSTTPKVKYQRLVEMMIGAGSKHEVLEKGVELGKMLAGLVEEEETVWKVLAGFWSEMIMYVAPSDNLDGHVKAVARGGELVTVLWVLLAHVGIVGRADSHADQAAAANATATAAASASGAV